MNDETRKRAAALLGKSEDEISDADLLDALEAAQAKDEHNRFNASLSDAKEKLTAHVARRAIPTAALDVAMADVEKAATADEREEVMNRFDTSWKAIPDGIISSGSNGADAGAQEEEPGAVDTTLASQKMGELVAEIRKESPSLSPYDVHQAAMTRLTNEEREAYKNETTTVADFVRGS